MKKILLIDGSSLIFRAFYAIRNLSTREGIPTGAVYGFMNMYNKAMDLIKPDYVLVAFDRGGPTLRKKEYNEYKANRNKTPDELLTQFGMVRDLLDSYGVKHIDSQDYEADDIIGTISKLSNEKNIESFMLTGDRDYFQLVDEKSKVLFTKKGISNLEVYDINKVSESYDGLKPKDLIQVKALMGDQSDNIPGVPGIGEKTAVKLIKEYSNLENIYDNLDNIKGKVLTKNLEENRMQAFMSRKLGEIIIDVPLDFDIEDLKVVEPNRAELYEKYKLLEFNSLTKEFANSTDKAENFNPKIVGINRIGDLYTNILKEKKLIFDIAIDSDYIRDDLRYIAIKGKDNQVLYLDLNKDKDIFVNKFKELFENDEIQKIGFDIKKSIVLLNKLGINFKNNYIDLMVLSYLINPNGSYSLKDIAFEYLNKDIKSLEEYLGKGKNKKNIEDLELVLMEEYLSNNIFILDKSLDILLSKIDEMDMLDLFKKIDNPIVKILADMEISGIEAHKDELEKLDVEFSKRIEDTKSKIYEYSDGEFNINSPKQLGQVLFEHLKLPIIKKTKTGYSTNQEVLYKLKNEHPIIELIEDYRQMTKLKSTYIDGLIPLISEDGRIHSKFNQTVVATGRLSSTEPNLQNIPIKTEEGRMIRKAFYAGKGKKFISCDYSQIELRILAAISEDSNMIQAFRDGIDIHTKTASEVFDVKLEDVTKLQRSEAKAVNFGIVYGISDYGLSEDLDISRKQAKKYIDGYLESYPNISKYMKDIVEKAKKNGYVETLFNRRRYIPEISSSNFNVRSFGERMALNTPIQGSAADIIKMAMIKVYERLQKENLSAKLILQIHDELIIESNDDEVEIVEKIMKEEMENVADIGVKLLVEAEIGQTWYEI